MTIQSLPQGLTPDLSAAFGTISFMHHANSHAGSRVDVVPAGNTNTVVLSAVDARNGLFVCAASGTNAGWTLVLPSTVSILAVFAPIDPRQIAAGSLAATQTVPFSKFLIIKNLNAQTLTLTAGDGSTTVSGTATVAQNFTRWFLWTFPTSSTILIENLGVLAL